MKNILLSLLFVSFCGSSMAQVPAATGMQILKAEDARRYDAVLEGLMRSPNTDVRKRAALAAGRIGDAKALPLLAALLEKDASTDVRSTAAFSLGEIESMKGADAIISVLRDPNAVRSVKARAVEAAGKIAAANVKNDPAMELAKALVVASIVFALDAEEKKGVNQDRNFVLFALTAILRTKAEGGDSVAAKFLTNADPRVRADAANTLSRLRSKIADDTLRKMLASDSDPLARANSARALGAAEDKEAFKILLTAAIEDKDSRVRVSAIRSLAALKDAKAADKLLERGQTLLADYKSSKFSNPIEKNELLEIATTLGRLLSNTGNVTATNFLDRFIAMDNGQSSEISIARLRIAPGKFSSRDESKPLSNWRQYSTLAQLLGEFAKIEPSTDEGKKMREEAPAMARLMAEAFASGTGNEVEKFGKAGPDFLRAFAEYKTDDLPKILRDALKNKDVFIRATAAELLVELPATQETTDALEAALYKSLQTDTQYNDAQLATLDALGKYDSLYIMRARHAIQYYPDYLVRKKAGEILKSKGITSYSVTRSIEEDVTPLKKFIPRLGRGRLGVILNTESDYRGALSRKNRSVKAILTTEKGPFTIDFFPEDAPLTVDNFVKLARSGYFNGLEVHRVVPNFVMQDGDPRGDGNGGPGWSIRCEINTLPFDRGAVGMALSGKDTGGSQWFVTHSAQPHLDGGYTVFGHVNEKDMKVVDSIVRGDKIISVTIVGK